MQHGMSPDIAHGEAEMLRRLIEWRMYFFGLGFSEDRSCKQSTLKRGSGEHLPTVLCGVPGPDGHGHAAIHHGANSSALDLWRQAGILVGAQ